MSDAQNKSIMLRISTKTLELAAQEAARRTIAESRTVTINRVLVEAIDRGLNAVVALSGIA